MKSTVLVVATLALLFPAVVAYEKNVPRADGDAPHAREDSLVKPPPFKPGSGLPEIVTPPPNTWLPGMSEAETPEPEESLYLQLYSAGRAPVAGPELDESKLNVICFTPYEKSGVTIFCEGTPESTSSVTFYLDGEKVRKENFRPWTMFADRGGEIVRPWRNPPMGKEVTVSCKTDEGMEASAKLMFSCEKDGLGVVTRGPPVRVTSTPTRTQAIKTSKVTEAPTTRRTMTEAPATTSKAMTEAKTTRQATTNVQTSTKAMTTASTARSATTDAPTTRPIGTDAPTTRPASTSQRPESGSLPAGYPENTARCITAAERRLIDMVNAYKRQQGVPECKVSKTLMAVAQYHVADSVINKPDTATFGGGGSCNMHSWSDKNPLWTPVCYGADADSLDGMWRKPREISGGAFDGDGYEISYMYSADVTPEIALDGWKSSSGHNAVVVQQGIWRDYTWRSIGCGIFKGAAHCWFAQEVDEQGGMPDC